MTAPASLTVAGFFRGYPQSRRIFAAVRAAAGDAGAFEQRVSKSQIAFKRRRPYAWAWIPAMYLKRDTAPLVLSVRLPRRDRSPRWKEVVEPTPGQFMHHLELFEPDEVDGQVARWLHEAWNHAEVR